MPYHIEAARNAILHYKPGNTDFVDGKMIFLQEVRFRNKHGIKFGRLSGIVAHFIPKYLQKTECLLGK
jgi:hypothetical protein